MLPTTVAAQDISLAFPVDCILGDTCFIQNYVDHDPSKGDSDFTCNALTYDGHKGTDVALPSLAAQTSGVNVYAAAPGVVTGQRDGVPDVLQTHPNAPDITGQECGNAVVITHQDGWETQYCHLAQNSVAVIVGQSVTSGEIIGQIGLSGKTQFPHLHLSLRQHGQVVDPFDPDGAITCGAPSEQTYWSEQIPYTASGFIAAGFSATVPSFDAIKDGTATAQTITQKDPMVFWGHIFGGRIGDNVSIRITSLAGVVFETTDTLERTQARLFRAGGLRAPTGGWPEGLYTGTVKLNRDGTLIDEQSMSIRVSVP